MTLLFAPFQPAPGLAIWSLIIFGLFWWLMAKYAFGPIARSLEKRDQDIQNALDEAKNAREEMSNLHAENERLLIEAREERAKILKEAKDVKNEIIAEARESAKVESSRIISNALAEIESQKKAALLEVKNQVGAMAIDIAEKVIRKQLEQDKEQTAYVESLIKEINP
ncbi:MAG: F0F1 ATP synthase subunit B [Saprospiraceae bacterium]|nr:F0F1 ATP synthase subunit B [Saprospiraceae bacterium]